MVQIYAYASHSHTYKFFLPRFLTKKKYDSLDSEGFRCNNYVLLRKLFAEIYYEK